MEDIEQIFLAAFEEVFGGGHGSQKELAKSAEIDASYLNRILKGKTPGSDNTRRRIAAALGYDGRRYEDFLEIGRSVVSGGSRWAIGALDRAGSRVGRLEPEPEWQAHHFHPEDDPSDLQEDGSEERGIDEDRARFFRLALAAFIQRDGQTPHAKRRNKDALARASGLDRELLNKYYLGRKEADQEAMAAIALAVNVPLADFIDSGRAVAEQMRAVRVPVQSRGVAESAPEWGRTPPPSHPAEGVGPEYCKQEFASSSYGKSDDLPCPGPVHHPSFKARPLPVIGLAACGLKGWERKMPVAVSATAPVFGPRTFVAIATGQSMVPASIGPGMLCYCDPDAEPFRGDAVYVYDAHQNACTIKEFVGWGPAAGTKEGFLKVRGWNDPDQWRRQTEYFIEINGLFVTELATVVCVRRRL